MTFARLLQHVDRLQQRRRGGPRGSRRANLREEIAIAQELAATCQISRAIWKLNSLDRVRVVPKREATDLEILISKLVRRLTLFRQFRQDVVSDEFCTFSQEVVSGCAQGGIGSCASE
jgi:hypothetical protein